MNQAIQNKKKTAKPTVAITLVHMLARFLQKNGLDFNRICAAAGTDPAVLTRKDERMPARQFLHIWNQAEQAAGDEHFGLHFGRDLAVNYLGGNILFGMMANCDTVGNALKVFCRYHLLMEDAVLPKMSIDENEVCLWWELFLPEVQIPKQHAESLLSALTEILRAVSQNRVNPARVCFSHAPPQNTGRHQTIFQAALLFDQPVNALMISRKEFDQPVLFASRELFEALAPVAERRLHQLNGSGSWSDKTLDEIRLQMSCGEAFDIETVAGKLAVSARSLQMKLQKEQTTFQQLLEQLRKEVALKHLNDPDTSICDIALLLGFSEQSAFNHAFKRWTGTSPGKYRKEVCLS